MKLINFKMATAVAAVLTMVGTFSPPAARAGLFDFSRNPAGYEDLFRVDSNVTNTSNDPNTGEYQNAITYRYSSDGLSITDALSASGTVTTDLIVEPCCTGAFSRSEVITLLGEAGYQDIEGEIFQLSFTLPEDNNNRTIRFYLPTDFEFQDRFSRSPRFSFVLEPANFPNSTLLGLDLLAIEATNAGAIDELVLPTDTDFRRFQSQPSYSLSAGFANAVYRSEPVPEPGSLAGLLVVGIILGTTRAMSKSKRI